MPDPLAELEKLFETPLFLIDKRKSKRLDFEGYKRKHAASKVAIVNRVTFKLIAAGNGEEKATCERA